jgi:hypothetical protein
MNFMEKLEFKTWLQEMVGTSVVSDPTQNPKEDWTWWGVSPSGKTKTGVSPKLGPIQNWTKKKNKNA